MLSGIVILWFFILYLDVPSIGHCWPTIDTKIVYSTIIELLNKDIEKKEMEKIILVDVPSQIYSELRSIFISLFEHSGFKDVKISEKVDFQKLYNLKKTQ